MNKQDGERERSGLRYLTRVGLLLLAFLAVLVALKLVFTPHSFGEYGFYRSSDVKGWMDYPIKYLQDPSRCASCHGTEYGSWEDSKHRSVHCETCHGPAVTHVQANGGAKLDKPISREFCGLCHRRLFSRPRGFPQVDLAEHGEGEECAACHNPHDPRPRGPGVEAPPPIPHSLEGLSDCLMCHNFEGIRPFPEDHGSRTNETCLACHKVKTEEGG
jgi:hypothetical protein